MHEAARTSTEAISNNSVAVISIGSQQHNERPKTPDIEPSASVDLNGPEEDIDFDIESEEDLEFSGKRDREQIMLNVEPELKRLKTEVDTIKMEASKTNEQLAMLSKSFTDSC